MLVGSGRATPAIIALLALATGSVGAFGFPAFQNALPRLVPREHLVAAVGLSNAQWNLGRIIGPSLAGIAIAIGGIAYRAVVQRDQLPRGDRLRADRPPRPVDGRAAAGVRARWPTASASPGRNADMRRMIPLMVVTILIGSPFIAFVSQMATVVFHGDEMSTSLLVAAQGIGAVAGAFTLGWSTHRFGLWRVMTGSIAVFAGALMFYGAAPALWVAAIGLAGCGFGYGSSFTTFAGLSQEAASEDMRGRALAVNTFILGALYPIGALVQGWLSDRIGLKWVTAGSGVLLFARPGVAAGGDPPADAAAVAGRSAAAGEHLVVEQPPAEQQHERDDRGDDDERRRRAPVEHQVAQRPSRARPSPPRRCRRWRARSGCASRGPAASRRRGR